MSMRLALLWLACAALAGGCTTASQQGTLAELENVEADVAEVRLDDSLQLAAESYRRYLNETARSPRTPEAMRRLADLQLEQEYGVLGNGEQNIEMAAPQAAARSVPDTAAPARPMADTAAEDDAAFEQRASGRAALLGGVPDYAAALPGVLGADIPAGPREAISTYWEILKSYPGYERNDHVLYQLSRAYDEIGEPDEAMKVMNRLIAQFPQSKFVDEVSFRRGEYFFVRKKYLDAEEAYGAIVSVGSDSSYYELALYKLGWALYKQDMYEEALHNFVAMLDHRQSIGYEFDREGGEDDEHRVSDTYRVISLSFSNLGGPEVVDEYFSANGARSYADRIYGNLGEFYFGKLRYDDAASVYQSFIALNPLHKVSPHFSMRVVEIYGEAGFPKLVVEAKKEFATVYALDAAYWQTFDITQSPEVVGFLKKNLTDLASHYHALYQDEELIDEQPASFSAAAHWYREFLGSFPKDSESPQINYQLADLLLEHKHFGDAAVEYERTAYEYAAHEQGAAAGYAAIFAHRQNLAGAAGAQRPAVMQATIDSSLKFADTYPAHERADVVLGAAADDLYTMENFPLAIASAHKLIERYPDADGPLRRSAWAVIAHSSIDLAQYQDAEHAYLNVLELTAADDDSRAAVIDGLAAAIYKQGEAANLLEDFRAAADHFLRIKAVAPDSAIRAAAEYDAAAALIKLEDWSVASGVLEDFRANNPEHELSTNATRQLAFVYREDGQIERAAAEHERIAAEAADPDLARESLLTAGELYDQVPNIADAVRVYQQYVGSYPLPLDIAMETRARLAQIFKDEDDVPRYHAQLREIVAVDRAAGSSRTDRSRYLAAKAALVLSELSFARFASVRLVQPFEHSLAQKQQRMDDALADFEALIGYQVAEVTAAATYYIAEIYLSFSDALLNSERPAGLAAADLADYEMAIEKEAYPFEERALEVHQENFDLLVSGVFNDWVQKSVAQLATLMPGRYAKNEISGGFVGSLAGYAYRMPNAPPEDLEEGSAEELAQPADTAPGPTDTPQSADGDHATGLETTL